MYTSLHAVQAALKDQGIEATCVTPLEDTFKDCTGRIMPHKKIEKFPVSAEARIHYLSKMVCMSRLEGAFRKLEWKESGMQVSGEDYIGEGFTLLR